MFRMFCIAIIVSGLLTLGGCQKKQVLSEKRSPAIGVVTLNGEPLRGGGTVKFQLVDNPRMRVSTSLDDNGQFFVGDAPLGKVRMTVVTTPELYPEMTPIPKKYSKVATSGLEATIARDDESFEIELKSK